MVVVFVVNNLQLRYFCPKNFLLVLKLESYIIVYIGQWREGVSDLGHHQAFQDW